MLSAKTLPLPSPLIKASKSPDANLTSTNYMGINKRRRKMYTNPSLSFQSSCLKNSSEPVVAPETHSMPAQNRVNILSEALPFIRKFHGKTIVVEGGGAAMKSEALQASAMSDLVLLSCVGLRIVFVHGVGPEIQQWPVRLGSKPNFVNGLDVTDATTKEIVSGALVRIVNKHLVTLINMAGATAVGLSGLDGHLLTAMQSPNDALAGDIATVDPTMLRLLIDNGHIPVIASVAADKTGQSYNINADIAAAEVAAALAAEKLILLTDVPGILEDRDDPGSLVKEVDIQGARRMMNDGKITGGMFQKVRCCVRSLDHGVRTASIIDGRQQHSLLLEILTDEGAGTMITG